MDGLHVYLNNLVVCKRKSVQTWWQHVLKLPPTYIIFTLKILVNDDTHNLPNILQCYTVTYQIKGRTVLLENLINLIPQKFHRWVESHD